MKKALRRGVKITLIASLSLLLLAGCVSNSSGTSSSSKPADSPKTASTPASQQRLTVSIMADSFSTQPPTKDDPVLKALEDYLNTNLNITWVPNNTINDKFNITLASGNLPDIMYVPDKLPSFISAVKAGAFWDLGPYLKDYPNLSQANPIVLSNSSINGKIYGIYRARTLGRMGISIRKDWLANVGLSEPKTIDDFHNLLKAFKNNDPNKDSKNDTYGMVVTKYNGPWDIMQTWFGVPNKWGLDQNGKLAPDFTFPQYMEALNFFRTIYKEGLVNQDFAVMEPSKWNDPIINNQAGIIVDVADTAQRLEDKLEKANPGKTDLMTVIGAVSGPSGLHNLPTSGYSGMFAIPKSSVKTEAQLKQVLTVLDKLNDKKAQVLADNGIEGRHYTLKDGYAVQTKDQNLVNEYQDLNQLMMFLPEDRTILPVQTPIRKQVAEVQSANVKIVVGNPAAGFVSQTYAQKGVQLDNIINDARTKFIVGQIDANGMKQAIDLWHKSGGDDYIKEINQLYEASKNK